MILEWCTDGLGDFSVISSLPIKRLELCSALELGGLSPSPSVLKEVRKNFSSSIFCMVRPRAGGFHYTKKEVSIMTDEIKTFARLGATGVVFGCLQENGHLDIKNNGLLLNTAKELGLKTTFHRAIDLSPDLKASFQEINKLGFDFVLTSGAKPTAIEGAAAIDEIIGIEPKQTKIIVGSGVRAEQMDFWNKKNIYGVHCTARKPVKDNSLSMGSDYEDDPIKLKSILEKINPVL